ncbi:MAG: hypothetical protein AAF556_11705, partial [Pseudomonadota bacterium]
KPMGGRQVFNGDGWQVSTQPLGRVLTILDEFEALLVLQDIGQGQRSDAGHLRNLVTMLDEAINLALQDAMGAMYGQPQGNAPALKINAGYETIKATVEGLGRASPSTLSRPKQQAVAEAIAAAKQAALTLDR